jgi:hypothetical protein
VSEKRGYAVYVKGIWYNDGEVRVDAWTRASMALSDPLRATRLRDHLAKKSAQEDLRTSGRMLRLQFALVVVYEEPLGDALSDEALFA